MRLYELEKGYKMVKGAPEYQPDGAKVSPFYQKELGPGWDKKSMDRDSDEIIPGTSAALDKARTDPNADYKAQMTTDFSGGGYTQTTRTDKGTKVQKFPSINAKITTTTTKPKGSTKLNTTNTFRGNL